MNSQFASNPDKEYQSDPSFVQLLKKVVSQSSDIIAGEVTLMKAEMSEAGRQVKKGTLYLIGSLIFVIAGLCVSLIGIASLLAENLPYWVSCLVIGAPVILIGLGLLMLGVNNLKVKELHPSRTADSVQEDIQVLKGEKI